MTGETLTPEQAHELLDLMAKGEGFDQGMDAGVALTLADIALQIDQPERAKELTSHAIQLAKQKGDNDQLAWALLTKARMTHDDEALTEAEEWVSMSEDDWLRSAYNNQCGIHALESGDIPTAKAAFAQSLALKEMLEDQVGQANTLYNLGEISREEGDIEQAKEFHARCVDLLEELDDKKGMANGLAIIGHLEAMEGNVDGAVIHYEAALEIAESQEDFEGTVVARWGLAEMARVMEDTDLELQHLTQVMTGFMQLGRGTPEPIKDRLNELADALHGGN
ncbi:MAG: tetratricopeptide repeat protein [Candidatus Thermoplasmatota archaeon]|nr:tetratricopeptide repeat protein [Candidatus Thermoplasmatota archaeon]MED5487054.1 tetratricopeptide repeat protein [Candidatus Thermoplasmatota archaeon]